LIKLQQTIWRFQQKNEKAYYLAVLRVLVSIWFIKELLFRWPAFDFLYNNQSSLKIDPSPRLTALGLDVFYLRDHYMVVVWLCLLLLALNLFGIGRNIVSLLLFLSMTVLYHINPKFANSGDEMSMLLLLYLSFANTFSHLVLYRRKPFSPEKEKVYNLVSNLATWSIVVNLCLSYFLAGAYKILQPYWQDGTAIYYFINDDRYSLFAAGSKHVALPLSLSLIIGYGTVILELLFPFLVFSKKTRTVVLGLCLLMHIGIYAFLMVYGMTIIFVIQYGLFYSNEEVMAAAEKIKAFLKKLFRFAPKQ
jgi:hypothetical protein